ncbi:MAG: diacylglycerol kinase [Patescibacteria group bacterium]|nr:diacylglycerol kinase [Patescibacteria group bacterium]MDE2438569.1 diacylglycerol kinase [Patescibacteria group bacterium]
MKHPRSRHLFHTFGAALNGIRIAFQEELSFKIMIAIAFFAIIAMIILPTSRTEKAVAWVMIFSVLVLELINAVVERILDIMYPDYNPRIGAIKDLMAGIVLVAALGSLIIAWLIFASKIPLLQSLV